MTGRMAEEDAERMNEQQHRPQSASGTEGFRAWAHSQLDVALSEQQPDETLMDTLNRLDLLWRRSDEGPEN